MGKNKEVEYTEWEKVWQEFIKIQDNAPIQYPEQKYVYSGIAKCYIDTETGKPVDLEKKNDNNN